MILVDREKLKNAVAGHALPHVLAYAVEGFFGQDNAFMHESLFGALVAEAHIHPDSILPDADPTEPAAEWTCKIDCEGDRLKMTVCHNGEELVYGKSYIQDDDDLGMMQAISYAAHMCYKMVQQRQM